MPKTGALTGSQVSESLTARVLGYEDGSTQNFYADGRTLYAAGAGESWGRWRVTGDQYCSSWPPSDSWACYGVEAEAGGLDLRFVDRRGGVSLGRYQDLQ